MNACLRQGLPLNFFKNSPLEEKIPDDVDLNTLRPDEKICPVCMEDQNQDSPFAILDSCEHSVCPTCADNLFLCYNEK